MIIESADAGVQTKVEEALNAGKEVVTEVVVKKLDAANVEKADKAKVEAEIKGTGAVIAQYLDLSVLLKIQGEEDINIANLDEPLTFRIAVPKDLQKDGRVFTVIRVHDGKAEALKTVEKDGILTFQTDRFSTYALTYTDDTTPKTGDTNNLLPWMGLLALAGVAGTGVAMLKRKEN